MRLGADLARVHWVHVHPPPPLPCVRIHVYSVHPALNNEISLFLSHFSVLFHSKHDHKIPYEIQQKCTLRSNVAIPLIFMTLIRLL